MSVIEIKENIGLPKYKQIIKSIEGAILNGVYKQGDKLPSVNSVRNRFSLSRDTVLLAYNDLKLRGIIQSYPGKGYYVKTENISTTQKIFLLFDELNAFKEDLYNSFLENLVEGVEVDIFFHHFNYNLFDKLIHDNLGIYNTYIIMPANLKNTNRIIGNLSSHRVYILDQTHKELSKYSGIFQNFEKDIVAGLEEARPLLEKYKKMKFIVNEVKEPEGLYTGFKQFVSKTNFDGEIIKSIENIKLQEGDVYLIPDDRNLIRIIKKIKEQKMILAKNVGIISYNDTLLKEIVEGGITTISTDFNYMGKRLAEMVLEKQSVKIENPNRLILRNSL